MCTLEFSQNSFAFLFLLHVLFCLKVGLDKIVNDKGCLQAGEEWLEHNLLTVAGIAVGIAFLQVLSKFQLITLHNFIPVDITFFTG